MPPSELTGDDVQRLPNQSASSFVFRLTARLQGWEFDSSVTSISTSIMTMTVSIVSTTVIVTRIIPTTICILDIYLQLWA